MVWHPFESVNLDQPLCQEDPSVWCSRDRRSLLKELYSTPPQGCSQDEGMARAYRLWKQTPQRKQPQLCDSPGYTSQLPLLPVSPGDKAHLALEAPTVVLARVPSRPQSPTSGVLLNEDSFVRHVTPIPELSHLHIEGWNIHPLLPPRPRLFEPRGYHKQGAPGH